MYLRMVKGEDSPVWRRLQKRFNRLADKKESCGGTNIQYLHAYPIEVFEKAIGTDVSFNLEHDLVSCSFTLNGSVHSARLGKYAKTRIKTILESGNEDAMLKFKERFHIGFCHMDGTLEDDHFWMVFRRPPRAKGLEITDADEILSLTDFVGLPEGGETDSTDSLTTDATLEALISSDFDLNTLDKWDKIKSN